MLIKRIHLRNLLSFGPESEPIELRPLNVFIGPNGSGKSNFLDAINLLRAAPEDIWPVIRTSGGVSEWIHRGQPTESPRLQVDVISEGQEVQYRIEFAGDQRVFSIDDEGLSVQTGQKSVTVFSLSEGVFPHGDPDKFFAGWDPQRPILSQFRDPVLLPEITALARNFSAIRCYRGWPIAPGSPLRNPQRTDGPAAYLLEDGSNLGLVLNRISRDPAAWRSLRETLQSIYEDIEEIIFEIDSSTVRVLIREKHFDTTSSRMSDGTLRFLCLLSVLLDPNPAPLICIDEPELGLHPDVIHKVAGLLRDASTRTQLIVTTHSRELLDALSDEPECVSVFERVDGQTMVKRLAGQPLLDWLKEYGVGRAWRDGELGGNRW